MEYIALYRKYRPKSFEDVCGQEIIVKILKNSIINSKIGHAYLFAGTRGTGKTSVAKIFAKAVNCEKNQTGDTCNECEKCISLENNDIDIIEIDAASNNGVDEIREIRNNAKLVPAIAKYKVYIIDEVHMLSTGAFNALLKTLEEPPEHVIFILATTEAHKIPLTIMSRCQRFDFKKIPTEILLKRLEYITEKENKKVDVKILKLISELGDGSFRDAINLLDQIIDIKEINEDFVYKISGGINIDEIINFLEIICSGNVEKTLDKINDFTMNGISLSYVIEKMLILLRDISVNNTVHEYFPDDYMKKLEKFDLNSEIIKDITAILLELLTALKKSINQKITFEIYFINIISKFTIKENNNSSEISDEKELIENQNDTKISSDLLTSREELNKIRINNTLATADKKLLTEINEKYIKLEDYISNKKYNNIARILLQSQVVCSGENNLIITMKSISIINSLNESIAQVESLLELILEKKYKIALVTEKEWDEIKTDFIKKKKLNIKYEIISEKSVIIKEEKSDTENEAIALFGQDSITVR